MPGRRTAGRMGGAARVGVWAYVVASLVAALSLAVVFELTFWTVVLIAFLVLCPIAIIWTYVVAQRPLPSPLGPAPATRGDVLFFHWIAPWYDYCWCPAFGLGRAFRERVVRAVAPRSGDHVLDVGCGTGWLTRRAADTVGPTGEAWGVDPAPDMIRLATQTAGNARSTARFKFAAVEALPFPDESFDVAVLSLVLHHLPPDAKARGLREIYRVMKRGGRLVVVDIDRPANWFLRALIWPMGLLLPNFRDLISQGVSAIITPAGFTGTICVARWIYWVGVFEARKPDPA